MQYLLKSNYQPKEKREKKLRFDAFTLGGHWDSIKDKHFTNRPEPIGELLYEIEVTNGEISPEFHENTLKN